MTHAVEDSFQIELSMKYQMDDDTKFVSNVVSQSIEPSCLWIFLFWAIDWVWEIYFRIFITGKVMVIVEYCRFGNVQNFLQKHREQFVDQIHPETGLIDPTIMTKEQRWSNDSGYDFNRWGPSSFLFFCGCFLVVQFLFVDDWWSELGVKLHMWNLLYYIPNTQRHKWRWNCFNKKHKHDYLFGINIGTLKCKIHYLNGNNNLNGN